MVTLTIKKQLLSSDVLLRFHSSNTLTKNTALYRLVIAFVEMSTRVTCVGVAPEAT